MFSHFNHQTCRLKLLTIAVVLLLVTSFSPPSIAGFAADDKSQFHLMEIHQFDTQGGRCYGFAAIWLYSKWIQFVHPEKFERYDNNDWYENAVTSILLKEAYVSIGRSDYDDSFIKFLSLVEQLQTAQFSGIEEEMNKIGIVKEKVTHKYSFASSLTINKLKTLLKEDIIRDHELIFVNTNEHTTAIFKDGKNYYYFDANSKSGERIVSSTDKIAELIFYAHRYLLSTKGYLCSWIPLPYVCANDSLMLGINIFSFDPNVSNYPDQKELLNRINSPSDAREMTLLHVAARLNRLETIDYFVNKKNVNLQDRWGITALMVAAQYGTADMVKTLLEHGAKPDIQNNDGWTALALAARYGTADMVKTLLEHGAKPDIQKNDGWPVLIIAARYGTADMVKILLEHGAKPDIQNNDGWTALIVAARYGTADMVKTLLEHGAKPDIQNNDGWTVLMMVAQYGTADMVKTLLEHKAEPNIKAANGSTALIMASRRCECGIISVLLEYGADPNYSVQTMDGKTALMEAENSRCLEAVKILLEYKDIPNIRDKNGQISTSGFPKDEL